MKKYTVALLLAALFLTALIFIFTTVFNSKKEQLINDSTLPSLKVLLQVDSTVSFRGISCVFDSIIWVSGSKSTVGKSVDAGQSWVFNKIPGIDSLQFRDIHAFDEKRVVVMSSGYPTRIFFTANGGKDWNLAFANDDERLFLDGMDFWPDGNGIAYGDPIHGIWTIVRTTDFGQTWYVDTANAPLAIDGEAGFAASGTGIRCLQDSTVYFGSGGTASKIYASTNRGATWKNYLSPLKSGSPSQGIFSLSAYNDKLIAVGGDYAIDTCLKKTVAIFNPVTHNWSPAAGLPYQSAVQIITDSVTVSVGTPGCYITTDQGATWEQFSTQSMHTLSDYLNSDYLYCAGSKGIIARIMLNN